MADFDENWSTGSDLLIRRLIKLVEISLVELRFILKSNFLNFFVEMSFHKNKPECLSFEILAKAENVFQV